MRIPPLHPGFWVIACAAFNAPTTMAAAPVFMEFTNSARIATEPMPHTPREQFNRATRDLHAGKLGDAESLLVKVLESQKEKFQAPALFNLGHTRFAQGQEHLKKSEDGRASAAQGRSAAERANAAAARARDVLAGNDLQQMVEAYMNGRGARRELKAAMEGVRRALDLHGAALRKWHRALKDFRSAAELNPDNADARRNAEVIEREIAKLVDSIREMQQAANQMAQSRQGLQEQMKQLGGRIPDSMMPPGARGEDEEEEDGENGRENPPKPEPGQHEKPGRMGDEIELSPEQAGWMLEAFQGDSDRRLPMGPGDTADPKNRNKGRDW
ncbi:MAG TPA: hypothetical protein VEH04_17880 [Verrucomicrobiae bacterium]|nr:hypothetical protein [Verrucomicrobiae bacterium]